MFRVDRTLSRVTVIPSSHRRDSAALLGTDDNRWATNTTHFPETIITTVGSLVNESTSISNVSVFSGQPSYLVPALNARTSSQRVASRTTDIQTQTTFTCPCNGTAGYQ